MSTVTEDILRKQLAFRSHLTQKEVNVVCRENEAMKQQLASLRKAARNYLEMNNPVNGNKLESLLQESNNAQT